MSKSALDFLMKSVISFFENWLITDKFTQYTMVISILCFILPRRGRKKKNKPEKLTRNSCLYIMQNRSTMQEQKLKQISKHMLYYHTGAVKEQKV